MSIAIILGVAMVTVVYVAIIMVCALHIRRYIAVEHACIRFYGYIFIYIFTFTILTRLMP